jgi:alcohol dehydrogenase class IV
MIEGFVSEDEQLKLEMFEFATATRIVFGAGAVREIGGIARTYGRRALVVTGKDQSRAKRLVAELEKDGLESVLFSVAGEPSISTVTEGVKHAKVEKCDLVLAFGGGSAIDAGKAIAAMLTNEGELLDYLEVVGRGKPITRQSAPFIAVPTTAGTGSEVTRNAVLASPEHKVKASLRSPLMLARAAVIDPELTHDLPAEITASTGLDALTQVIEPYVCARSNPLTDSLCVEGIRRATRSLRRAFENGQDAGAREDMAIASLFGGFALANAGLGAVHGFAGPIGGMFPAPHGAICAVLLAPVMEANIRALEQRAPQHQALARYEEIARITNNRGTARARDGVEWVRRLVSDLRVPPLRTYGITDTDVPEIVEKATQASSMKANPIVLTKAELEEVLNSAI